MKLQALQQFFGGLGHAGGQGAAFVDDQRIITTILKITEPGARLRNPAVVAQVVEGPGLVTRLADGVKGGLRSIANGFDDALKGLGNGF